MEDGVELLTLPVSNVILASAFGAKSSRVKKQALISFKIDNQEYEVVTLVASKLTMDIILGVDYLRSYHVVLNFNEAHLETRIEYIVYRHSFNVPQVLAGSEWS
jgi:predicted aspartyl protease